MLSKIKIENHKCLHKEEVHLTPLSFITGANSSGKSAFIEAMIPTAGRADDKSIHYLDVGSMKVEDWESRDSGSNLYSIFDRNKCEPVENNSNGGLFDVFSNTLAGQVSGWLSYISGVKNLELDTQSHDGHKIQVMFKDSPMSSIRPSHMGSGVSNLARIIIMCLMAKKGNVIIMEDPDVRLHPQVQSRLAKLFCWVVARGVQMIVNTNSAHMIDVARYHVYKNVLTENDVSVHYKKDSSTSFESFGIDLNGKFIDQKTRYPKTFSKGFFDTNLEELIEIGG